MTRLHKQMYRTLKGEKKINCYMINIPRKIAEKANINSEDKLKISVINNKIMIEKEQ